MRRFLEAGASVVVGDLKAIERATRAVQESVRTGESLAQPLTEHPVFPPMVVQMIGVGEATGDRDLQAEGQADQAKGNLKQAGEKVKDVFK